MDRSRSISAAVAAVAAIAVLAAPLAAQQAAPVVLHTSTEQIPLKTYAEMMRTGVLRIVSGSERDIPTVADVGYFKCALTGWSPAWKTDDGKMTVTSGATVTATMGLATSVPICQPTVLVPPS